MLSAYLTAKRLRWQGSLPHTAMFSSLNGDMERKVGRPRFPWEMCDFAVFNVLGETESSLKLHVKMKCLEEDVVG